MPGSGGDMRIVVAEDNPTARAALVALLRDEGHEPEGVSTGTEAIAACARIRPDVVILDYKLPDMTGLDLLAKVGRNGDGSPRVFLMTGQRLGRKTCEAAAGMGALVFRKPLRVPEFLGVVGGTARGRALQGRQPAP